MKDESVKKKKETMNEHMIWERKEIGNDSTQFYYQESDHYLESIDFNMAAGGIRRGMSSKAAKTSLFKDASDLYATFRPTYPLALYDTIGKRLAGKDELFIVDVACGTGQATFQLATSFSPSIKRILAFDVSESQIEEAKKMLASKKDGEGKEAGEYGKIDFAVGDGAPIAVEDGSVDLLTCAQAYHWFVPTKFWEEAARVTKTGGAVAVWGYDLLQFDNKEADEIISTFHHKTLGEEYWDDARWHVIHHYRDLEVEKTPSTSHFTTTTRHDFKDPFSMNIDHVIGYLSTWSGYRTYLRENKVEKGSDTDPLVAVRESLFSTIPSPDTLFTGHVPMFLLLNTKL